VCMYVRDRKGCRPIVCVLCVNRCVCMCDARVIMCVCVCDVRMSVCVCVCVCVSVCECVDWVTCGCEIRHRGTAALTQGSSACGSLRAAECWINTDSQGVGWS